MTGRDYPDTEIERHRKRHAGFVRIPEGDADHAVIFIHGILGSPTQFEQFYPAVPAAYAVYAVCLRGHGGTAREFTKSRMSDWKSDIDALLCEVERNHQNILLVGHSLGALLAIRAALEHVSVKRLVLLNAPLRVHIRAAAVKNALAFLRGSDSCPANAKCSVFRSKNPFVYPAFLPNFAALLAEIRRVRVMLPSLTTPTTAFFSAHDELVSARAAELPSMLPCADVRILPSSTHFLYPEPDAELVRRALFPSGE